MQKLSFILLFCCARVLSDDSWALVENLQAHAYPCTNESSIITSFEPGLQPGEDNQYHVSISKTFPRYTQINMKFDTEAVVTLDEEAMARITPNNDFFNIRFFYKSDFIGFSVKGTANGSIPYFGSLIINNVECCKTPLKGYLDAYVSVTKVLATAPRMHNIMHHTRIPDGSCGRRIIDHSELIDDGAGTKPGDWPWHAAIYRVDRVTAKYICGGTLLSKNFVLTAAHCATIRGDPILPEILNVVLGKYNLYNEDLNAQEKSVHEVIVHKLFDHKQLEHDIALLKLKSEITFGDYVQPACLWYPTAVNKIPKTEIKGTVVGWGIDQTKSLATQLRKATMPLQSIATCVKSNPQFYSKVLTHYKFCAGLKNGTSACNGDSGGGFHVFVPDVTGNAAANASGAWHIYGIVSLSVSQRDTPVCDPTQYVVYTKISEYRNWITKYVN